MVTDCQDFTASQPLWSSISYSNYSLYFTGIYDHLRKRWWKNINHGRQINWSLSFTVPHHTYLFYGSQAVYERWVTNSQPQWRQLWSGMLRPGSPKGIEKSVETVLESGLSCCVLNRSWTVHKGWVTDSWPVMASASPSKSLPQLWSAEKKKKKREGERRAWKLFWKLDCLAVINRSRTMQKRWVTDSWPVMASASP